MTFSERKRHWIHEYAFMAAIAAALLLFSIVVIHWDLDRAVSGRFHSIGEGWFLGKQQPWLALYRYGEIPGVLLGVGGLIGWLICRARKGYRRWSRYFIVILLSVIIGPGLLVNGILKPVWGRPRPRQVQEFGGTLTYRHMSQPDLFGQGRSFACGHCAMGFVFLSLLVFRREKPGLAYAGAAIGVLLGGALGITRVVQGGHFLSDVVWSMGIVSLTIIGLHTLLIKNPGRRPLQDGPPDPAKSG